MAIKVFSALHNGVGGIDWAGLDLMVDVLGIDDVEDLVHRLRVIKNHRPQAASE